MFSVSPTARASRRARREARAVGDTENMGVDGDRRLAISLGEDDAGSLAADTGKGFEVFARAGGRSAMTFENDA